MWEGFKGHTDYTDDTELTECERVQGVQVVQEFKGFKSSRGLRVLRERSEQVRAQEFFASEASFGRAREVQWFKIPQKTLSMKWDNKTNKIKN